MARKKVDHFLIGKASSDLKESFLTPFTLDPEMDVSSQLPFTGPQYQLPSQMNVLKLRLFMKDTSGKKNSHKKTSAFNAKTALVVSKYWEMAGFKTWHIDAIRNGVDRLVKRYEGIRKSRAKTSKDAIAKRAAFLSDMKKLFDVADQNLVEDLKTDRVRNNLGVVTEDLEFYLDQLESRQHVMTKVDVEFSARKAANLKRKAPVASTSRQPASSQSEVSSDEEEENESQVPVEEEKDEDYNCNNAKKPRSNTITVTIPRDLLNAEMTKSLDRAKTSDGRAMEIISPLLKSFKTLDGKPLSLDELTISRSSIRRKRIKYRDQISDEAFEEFQVNMPEHCILHWDSKALSDMDGVMHEIEAVTTSGWPQYTEGKMICAVEMVDENGENTSKGEHQAECVWSNAEQWNIIPRTRGMCFDTTASNAGRIKGAAIVLHLRCVH